MPQIRFMTLSRFIIEQEKLHPEATGELSKLLHDLSLAAKVISLEVNKAGLADILGFTGDSNVHGEDVRKLDMFAHNMMLMQWIMEVIFALWLLKRKKRFPLIRNLVLRKPPIQNTET